MSVPDDLNKLSDVVKHYFVKKKKKTKYDELVKKVNDILLILVIWLKKLAMTQKSVKLKIKYLIIILYYNLDYNLMSKNFDASFRQANLFCKKRQILMIN